MMLTGYDELIPTACITAICASHYRHPINTALTDAPPVVA